MIDVNELCRRAVVNDTLEKWDAAAYACGFVEPNYPVPSTLGVCEAFPDVGHCLCLYAADSERHNPLVTWYDFEFAKRNGLGIPKDHGLAVEWN